MEESYVKAVMRNTSDFCKIFNDYENELQNLGVKYASLQNEVEQYGNYVKENGNPSKESYDRLDDDRKYQNEDGSIVEYEDLTISQKRRLNSEALFIADKEIELNDQIDLAEIEMRRSALKVAKDMEDKLNEIDRSKRHLNQIKLQYVADFSRIENTISDCQHDLLHSTTIDEKKMIVNTLSNAINEKKRIELAQRVNDALINATDLFTNAFASVISSVKTSTKNEFANVDEDRVEFIDEKMDILTKVSNLMNSFSNLSSTFENERALIQDINDECEKLTKDHNNDDIKKFAQDVTNITKNFSDVLLDAENTNTTSKVVGDTPSSTTSTEDAQDNTEEDSQDNTQGGANEGTSNESEEDEKEDTQDNTQGGTNEGTSNESEEDEKEDSQDNTQGGANEGTSNESEEDKKEDSQGQGQPTSNPVTKTLESPEYKVNRARQAKSAVLNNSITACAVGIAACTGLGLAPVAGAVFTGGLIVAGGIKVADGIITIAKKNAATHKLKKIAKKVNKAIESTGRKVKLGDFDYEKGTVFYDYQASPKGEFVPLNQNEDTLDVVNMLNDELSYEFKNESRGLGDQAHGKLEVDMKDMPKVTVNNLEAAYAPIGGISSFKEDTLKQASGWSTASSWLAKVKDKLFTNNIEDKEEVVVEAYEPIADTTSTPAPSQEENTNAEVNENTNAETPAEEQSQNEDVSMADLEQALDDGTNEPEPEFEENQFNEETIDTPVVQNTEVAQVIPSDFVDALDDDLNEEDMLDPDVIDAMNEIEGQGIGMHR
jgi:hypothetical protein